MTIIQIASVLGVSKSFLYSLTRTFPLEVPKHLDDVESWSEFVHRHRVQPTGNDGPPRRRSR
jgi:hypothetical protein